MPLRYPAERIVIRCPNWIGDAVMATAAVRCVRRNYPQARISLLLRPYVRGVFEGAPWADEIIEIGEGAGPGPLLRAAGDLRRGRFDLAVLLTHSFRSALAAWLGGARRRVGHARSGRSWLLTDAVPWPRPGRDPDLVSKVAVYRSLLDYLGCEGSGQWLPELFVSPEEERLSDELLARHNRDAARPMTALVPGAAYGASKLWPPERFAAVADALSRAHGAQAVILTGPGEGAIGRLIAETMRDTPIIFDDREMTFARLKAIVRRCALMVCNDTGPRHIAIAWAVPTVVIMGPTDPAVTESPYERAVILRQDVPCGPCRLRACPTDHRCMLSITVPMVMDAAEELLKRYPVSPAREAGPNRER